VAEKAQTGSEENKTASRKIEDLMPMKIAPDTLSSRRKFARARIWFPQFFARRLCCKVSVTPDRKARYISKELFLLLCNEHDSEFSNRD